MAWLRRLDAQTRSYSLNPAILGQKLARGEGVVTLWDLPDVLIWQSQGMPFGYTFPPQRDAGHQDAIAHRQGEQASAGGRAVHRLRRRHRGPDSGGEKAGACRRAPTCRWTGSRRWVADVERRMVTAPDGLAATRRRGRPPGCGTGTNGCAGRAEVADREHGLARRRPKQFGATVVVHNVSLVVADGEVVALLGPRAVARPHCSG